MTSMERVLAAMQGQSADRRAFTATLSLYGARLTNADPGDYYSDPAVYRTGQRAVVDVLDPDILFSPFALSLEARAFGSILAQPLKSPPMVRKHAALTATGLASFSPPSPDMDPGLAYLVQSARMLVEEFGTTRPVCGILTSPLDLPVIILGMESWLETVLFERETARAIMTVTGAHFLAMAKALFNAGVAFVSVPMMLTNPRIILESLIPEFIIPEFSTIVRQLPGPLVFHHGGNRIAASIAAYRNIPSVAGFLLDYRDSFAEVRQKIGDSVLLLGGLDGPWLVRVSPSDARKVTSRILADRAHDPRFILASTGADVGWDTSLDTLRAVKAVVMESGPVPVPEASSLPEPEMQATGTPGPESDESGFRIDPGALHP